MNGERVAVEVLVPYFFETSALSGRNVEVAFRALAV